MYKKPITETIPIESTSMMESTIGVSPGGTDSINGTPTGDAPKRRTEVF